MPAPQYEWRRLTPAQRLERLAWRKDRRHPWHSPPHRPNFGGLQFLVTAACFEHRPHIGRTPERMEEFSRSLLATLAASAERVVAWCVLPNHYHALVETRDVLRLLQQLGKLRGRTSRAWNGEDSARGRKVFFRAVERAMRSDAHSHSTVNYVHHNPVRHGYVERWTDWPWSSARQHLDEIGLAEASRRWRRYPVLSYGADWDDPAL